MSRLVVFRGPLKVAQHSRSHQKNTLAAAAVFGVALCWRTHLILYIFLPNPIISSAVVSRVLLSLIFRVYIQQAHRKIPFHAVDIHIHSLTSIYAHRSPVGVSRVVYIYTLCHLSAYRLYTLFVTTLDHANYIELALHLLALYVKTKPKN